jgi:dTDP-4-amino-4,6-dideoxygalactose transaminase
MTIPVMRPWLGPEEIAAVTEVLESGWIAQGAKVRQFETELAARVQATEGVAVSNATAGLHLSMHLLGVSAGDEVIVPSLSFIATANAVLQTGARPVFADVDEATQNLTAKTIEERLTDRTKAVMVVDQAGVPVELAPIRALCDPLGIPVVEDAACGLGSTRDGRPVGADVDLAVFSFHPRKVITTGEGGMVVTDRPEWATRLRRLREHGMSHSAFDRHATDGPVLESYLEPGFNYRMTDLQAAVGVVQLGRLGQMIEERRAGARRYHTALAELAGVQRVTDPAWGTTNYQSYWIVLPDDFPLSRDEVLARFEQAGVSARRGIMAAHLEPAYASAEVPSLPVTERLTRQSLILPLFHGITEAEQDQVVSVLFEASRVRT